MNYFIYYTDPEERRRIKKIANKELAERWISGSKDKGCKIHKVIKGGKVPFSTRTTTEIKE